MAEITAEWLEKEADKVVELFKDGFQLSDMFQIVPKVMEAVELVSGLSGEEKKKTAESVAYLVIDKTDIPWLPDSLVDPILKKFVPGAIEALIQASKGGFAFNNDKSEA